MSAPEPEPEEEFAADEEYVECHACQRLSKRWIMRDLCTTRDRRGCVIAADDPLGIEAQRPGSAC